MIDIMEFSYSSDNHKTELQNIIKQYMETCNVILDKAVLNNYSYLKVTKLCVEIDDNGKDVQIKQVEVHGSCYDENEDKYVNTKIIIK